MNEKLTEEQLQAINIYLKEVINNNSKCLSCNLNHSEFCFFAYECIIKNFCHYTQI